MTAPKLIDPIAQLRHVNDVVRMLLAYQVKTATKFITPKLVVRAHRITIQGRIDRRERSVDIRVKIGIPNYHERLFVKDCIKAGEPFPVKKVRLAHFRVIKRKAKGKKKRT